MFRGSFVICSSAKLLAEKIGVRCCVARDRLASTKTWARGVWFPSIVLVSPSLSVQNTHAGWRKAVVHVLVPVSSDLFSIELTSPILFSFPSSSSPILYRTVDLEFQHVFTWYVVAVIEEGVSCELRSSKGQRIIFKKSLHLGVPR
jgi:hypothetical protein